MIEPPTDTFLSALESIAEVREMSVLRMELAPDVDEGLRIFQVFGRVQYPRE